MQVSSVYLINWLQPLLQRYCCDILNRTLKIANCALFRCNVVTWSEQSGCWLDVSGPVLSFADWGLSLSLLTGGWVWLCGVQNVLQCSHDYKIATRWRPNGLENCWLFKLSQSLTHQYIWTFLFTPMNCQCESLQGRIEIFQLFPFG